MLENVIDKISLFKVVAHTNDNTQIRLLRLADVGQGGLLQAFYPSDKDEYRFSNRKSMNALDIQLIDSSYGYWKWSATPIGSDPEKDHVELQHDNENAPLMVIILDATNTFAGIVERLNAGISMNAAYCDIMFAYKDQNNNCIHGVICKQGGLREKGSLYILSSEISKFSEYVVKFTDLIEVYDESIDSKLFFLSNKTLKKKEGVYSKVDELSLVKEILKKKYTRAEYLKAYGGTRDDFQRNFDVFNKMLGQTLLDEISEELFITKEEANSLLDELTARASTVIEKGDIDQSILSEIIKSNSDILQQCEQSITEKWRSEHSEEINDAKDTIKCLKHDADEISKCNIKLKQENKKQNRELEQTKEKRIKIESEIKKKEEISKAFSDEIKEKLNNSNQSIVNILTEYGLFGCMEMRSNNSVQTSKYQICENTTRNENIVETCESWKDNVNLLVTNLEGIGVDQNISQMTAAFLYTALLKRHNLLICGPKGEEFGNALSFSVSGVNAATITCAGDYIPGVIEEINQCVSDIIIVKNLFNSGWKDRFLPDIEGHVNKLMIYIHPFYEDMIIEPAGLYNYMIPFITDTVLSCNISEQLICGTKIPMTDNLRESRIANDFLSPFHVGNFYLSKIENEIAITKTIMEMNDMSKEDGKIDEEYFAASLQYALITGKGSVLNEYIESHKTRLFSPIYSLITKILGDENA